MEIRIKKTGENEKPDTVKIIPPKLDYYGSFKAVIAALAMFFSALQGIQAYLGLQIISAATTLPGYANTVAKVYNSLGTTPAMATESLMLYLGVSLIVFIAALVYYLIERKKPGKLGRGWIVIWVLESWITLSYVGVILELVIFYYIWTRVLHLKNPYSLK